MPLIVTLSLNPTLDLSTETPEVLPGQKTRCATPRQDPGGGGVNVARVARVLGASSAVVFPSGGPAGDALQTLLAAEGTAFHAVPIAGQTRQSLTVQELCGEAREFRFVLPGPTLSAAEFEACLAAVVARARDGAAFVIASGRLPPGAPEDAFARLRAALPPGPRLIVDTSGEPLRLARGAFIVKPNLAELEAVIGHALPDDAARAEAARRLIAAGVAERVLISLAEEGALLVTADAAERFPALPVVVRTTVGAGDSAVAGLAVALAGGATLRDAVRFAMAAGAAALLRPGTQLCLREDVERLAGMTVPAG
ncbi:MAG: 1-phosphofructokinase family hexose kinase [Acetobacteraceae bacterium]|nr:1-phosphofructokinase family hexose kinase [Acetobacteraceae bacterium]